MRREHIEFEVGGDSCAAWLYPAPQGAGSPPIMAMAHGLSGTRRDGLGPFGDSGGEVATFGSSMGGGNALAAAVGDRAVAAVVSQVPFLDRVPHPPPALRSAQPWLRLRWTACFGF